MTKIFKNSIVLFILLHLCSFSVFAHEGAIKGTVNDSLSGEKVEGVTIHLVGTNQITSTDLLGNFTFSDLHPGAYQLRFSSLGYEALIKSVEVTGNETSKISVLLNPSIIVLSEVMIAPKGEIGSTMQTISKIDIELRPTQSSQDVLRMVPGLITAQHAGGGKSEQIFLRGFDIDHGTDIKLDVDGIPVNMVSHAHGQGYADLHFLTPEVIDYVDFNKGPYYAQHGDFNTSGYASFKTKIIWIKVPLSWKPEDLIPTAWLACSIFWIKR